MADRSLPPNGVAPKLKKTANTYKFTLPVVTALGNEALQERHWLKIADLLGQPIVRDENFTLEYLIDLNVMEHREHIEQISTEATQEAGLEAQLNKVQTVWASADFILNPYKESKDIFTLAGLDEIYVQLDDSMVIMQTILASRFVAGIREEVPTDQTLYIGHIYIGHYVARYHIQGTATL